MLRSALGDRVSESATFPAMLAENVEIEHPYAPDGSLRIVGRATLVAHLRDTLARFTVERAATRYVYHCEPRGAVIVEFDLAGRRLRSARNISSNAWRLSKRAAGGSLDTANTIIHWQPLHLMRKPRIRRGGSDRSRLDSAALRLGPFMQWGMISRFHRAVCN